MTFSLADINECQLGLCNQSDSWCVNLRGSFACCTANSTLSNCIGREIIVGHENSLGADNTKKEPLILPSIIKKIVGDMDAAISSFDNASSADTGRTNGSWIDRLAESKLSIGARSNWVVGRVGELRNFTGHAVIIGRGRIESKKWNAAKDRNGALIEIGMHQNHTKRKGQVSLLLLYYVIVSAYSLSRSIPSHLNAK